MLNLHATAIEPEGEVYAHDKVATKLLLGMENCSPAQLPAGHHNGGERGRDPVQHLRQEAVDESVLAVHRCTC